MPKINPKIIISIIIPVYNSERFLQDCLDSVLVQNSNNIEIIIIDDCSTDNSNQICNLYCENNDNIYLITNKTRVGVSSSRNIGLANAGGKYIIFLDSDDLLIKNTIKKLIIFLNNFKIVDIVVIKKHLIKRGNKLINSNEIISNINNNTNIVDNFLSNNQNQVFKECWAFIYNRNYLLDNQILFIPNINFAEDQEFTAKVFCLSESLTYYDIPIYCFRQSQGSLSHNNGYDICISCLKVINEMTKFIRKYNLSHDKKIFMTKSIGTVINELTPMLICLNNHEIKNLTHFIIKYFDNKSLNMLIDNENVFYYINQLGSYNGMIKYKSIYSQQIINLVKNAKNMQIYVFCKNIYALSIIHVLSKAGFLVAGILDNNELLDGQNIIDMQIKHPNIFNKSSSDEISDVFVIICNQQKNIVNDIYNQLKKLGFKPPQITHKNFHKNIDASF